MPIWEYRCEKCEEQYEVILAKSTDRAYCEKCETFDDQKKLITGLGNAYATDDDSPKTKNDLANYWGNGIYRPGYKMGTPHS